MALSQNTGKTDQGGQAKQEKPPATSRPPTKPIPEGQECYLKGLESRFEVLEGVQHGPLGEYRLWEGPSLLATQYICSECSERLGYSMDKEA
ncbi:hypothetical protein SAMD00023353_3000770 [Rosellinia necatrix]|uniref:Uncharacterized protein n=1 Tax=Rosellinia necatrix TaxID=77044 RepID=A0A1S8A8K8_ROSNE|nr:hypothetical protein SAMD00023353_3000770 [Rosellinia necatrix]